MKKREIPIEKDGLQWNKKAHWQAYRNLQKKVDTAWEQLQRDIEKKASHKRLLEDKNHLMLLLGECDYMTREYMRWMERR